MARMCLLPMRKAIMDALMFFLFASQMLHISGKLTVLRGSHTKVKLLFDLKKINMHLRGRWRRSSMERQFELAILLTEQTDRYASRYLIIDTKQKINYDKSRILSEKCINIPQSEIKPGMRGFHFLEWSQEDLHSYELYTHRSSSYVDIIILLDWDTTQESLTSATGLHVLKDTLKKWDLGTKYNKIKILNGGYQEWLQRYPAFATNPPNVDNQITESKNIENEILETIDVDEEMDKDDSPRRRVSNQESKTPVPESSKKSLLKSSQKDVNKYRTLNKGNVPQMENTMKLIENVDKKRRSSQRSKDKKRRSSRRRVTFCAEAYIDLTED